MSDTDQEVLGPPGEGYEWDNYNRCWVKPLWHFCLDSWCGDAGRIVLRVPSWECKYRDHPEPELETREDGKWSQHVSENATDVALSIWRFLGQPTNTEEDVAGER